MHNWFLKQFPSVYRRSRVTFYRLCFTIFSKSCSSMSSFLVWGHIDSSCAYFNTTFLLPLEKIVLLSWSISFENVSPILTYHLNLVEWQKIVEWPKTTPITLQEKKVKKSSRNQQNVISKKIWNLPILVTLFNLSIF